MNNPGKGADQVGDGILGRGTNPADSAPPDSPGHAGLAGCSDHHASKVYEGNVTTRLRVKCWARTCFFSQKKDFSDSLGRMNVMT